MFRMNSTMNTPTPTSLQVVESIGTRNVRIIGLKRICLPDFYCKYNFTKPLFVFHSHNE